LKDAQSIGMPPTSVAGGNCAEGNWLPMAGLCGHGSERLPGPLALMAPVAEGPDYQRRQLALQLQS